MISEGQQLCTTHKILPNNNAQFTSTVTSIDKYNGRTNLQRLATFRLWSSAANGKFLKSIFARAGFSYTGEGDRVKCDSCQLSIDVWTGDMNPIDEHVRLNPNCSFVLSNSELFKTTVVPTAASLMENSSSIVTDNVRESMDWLVEEVEDKNTSEQQQQFFRSLPQTTIDSLQMNTFSRWNLITPSVSQMVAGGWWFTNIADRVICIHCHAIFHKWTEADKPFEIHRLKSPSCSFVKMSEQITPSYSSQLKIANDSISEVLVSPVHDQFRLPSERRATFEKHSQNFTDSMPSIELFVDAGFFYTENSSIVRCFYCDGALKNWHSTDDPKIEHARWFPHCFYIRKMIGENLYQAIQRKNQALRAQENYSETSQNVQNNETTWTLNEIERMVKARIDLPIVDKLRKEGFRLPIIKKALEIQLKSNKDDFKSNDDLRIAYFILEQQMKIVNGNEQNILIPSQWILNSPPIQSQSSSNVSKQSEVLVQQKVTQSSQPVNADDKLCIICLSNERQVACLPCGHLCSCTTCGFSCKNCPVCRALVKSFVRVYL